MAILRMLVNLVILAAIAYAMYVVYTTVLAPSTWAQNKPWLWVAFSALAVLGIVVLYPIARRVVGKLLF